MAAVSHTRIFDFLEEVLNEKNGIAVPKKGKAASSSSTKARTTAAAAPTSSSRVPMKVESKPGMTDSAVADYLTKN